MQRIGTWLGLVLFFFLCTLPANSANEPYDIYVVMGVTGPSTFVGAGVQTSLTAGERYINETGGIRGRPVHFVVLDDQTNPVTTVQLVNQLIAKHVPVFLGPGGASACQAAQPIIDQNGGPVGYCISNSVHPPPGSFMFAALRPNTDFATAALRYLDDKKDRKIAILTATDSAGRDGEEAVLESIKDSEFSNLRVVANEHFTLGDLSVRAQIARIKAAGADAIVAWTTGPPFGTILHGLQESGWNGIVLTNGANINQKLITGYAGFLPHDLIFTGAPYSAISNQPARVKSAKAVFLSQMRQIGIDDPDLTQMLAWDPMLVIVDALRHVGTDASPKQVRDYILKLRGFAGVNGMYDFQQNAQRGLAPKTPVVVQWDASGQKFVTVSRPGGQPL